MVIEWIMSRTADDVRQVDNEYRAECREWRFRKDRVPAEGGDSREQNGWVLEELHPITTNSLELWLEPTGCRRALAELWGKLQQEELIAEGLPCSGGPRVKIPSLEWSDLEPREEGRAREYFGYRHEPWGRTYTDVLVKRDDVLRLWHATDAEKPEPTQARSAGASFATADRTLFPTIAGMLKNGSARGAYGAALQLALGGKLAGAGTPESKAKRVSTLFRREHNEQ